MHMEVIDQDRMIDDGHALLRGLAARGMPARACLWVRDAVRRCWRLRLQPHPDLTEESLVRATVARVLEDEATTTVDAQTVDLAGPDDPIVRSYRRMITVDEPGSLRMQGNIINQIALPDVIILLLRQPT